MTVTQEAWMGLLVDGRVIGHWEPLPADLVRVDGKAFKRAWRCVARRCGAPAGVTCRCREAFGAPP